VVVSAIKFNFEYKHVPIVQHVCSQKKKRVKIYTSVLFLPNKYTLFYFYQTYDGRCRWENTLRKGAFQSWANNKKIPRNFLTRIMQSDWSLKNNNI